MFQKIAEHGANSSLYKFLLSCRRRKTSNNHKDVLGCGFAMYISNVSSILSNLTSQCICQKHVGKPYKEVGCHLRRGGPALRKTKPERAFPVTGPTCTGKYPGNVSRAKRNLQFPWIVLEYSEERPIRLNFFETRYESSLVCPTKVLS